MRRWLVALLLGLVVASGEVTSPWTEKSQIGAEEAKALLKDLQSRSIRFEKKRYRLRDIFTVTPETVTFRIPTGLKGVPVSALPKDALAALALTNKVIESHAKKREKEKAEVAELIAKQETDRDVKRLEAKAAKHAKEALKLEKKIRADMVFKIEQVLSNGALVKFTREIKHGSAGTTLFPKAKPARGAHLINNQMHFVRGSFLEAGVVDGDFCRAFVVPDGSYQYTTTVGAPATVKAHRISENAIQKVLH